MSAESIAKYLAIDVETTGLSPDIHCIVELAAMPLDAKLQKMLIEPLHLFIRPPSDAVVDPYALKINGHTWSLDTASEKYQQALEYDVALTALASYIEKHWGRWVNSPWIVPVGWNVSFDISFVQKLYSHTPLTTSSFWPFHYHTLDLLTICRYLDVCAGRERRSYKLDALVKEFFPEEAAKGEMHTALADCEMMLKVLEKFERMPTTGEGRIL
jgi:DNA polymerase III alpha subunit (gram-positive type)